MQAIGILESIQVGVPQTYPLKGASATWDTSFFRIPVAAPRMVFRTHLDGNYQADTKHHGLSYQAILFYAAEHYPHWQKELNNPAINAGGFGENFTVSGISEANICAGDILEIGEAKVQISVPRYPCWKIAKRWNIENLTDLVAATGRTGWYCSVLQEGMVQPKIPIYLLERPYPQWPIALINDLGHGRFADIAAAQELLHCPILQDPWPEIITKKFKNIHLL